MSSEQPDYISSPTTLPIPQGPYHFRNVDMAVFSLNAKYLKLKAICDRYLNQSSTAEFIYRPALPYVFVIYLGMEFQSTVEDPPIGWIPEHEVSFWIPIAAYKNRYDLTPDHFISFSPYLFLDDYYAIVLGREVYGFRKQQGQFTKLPSDISAPELDVNTVGFKNFGPDEVAKAEYLMSIKHFPDSTEQVSLQCNTKEKARELIIQQITEKCLHPLTSEEKKSLDWLEHQSLDITAKVWVFLKQFRDNVTPSKACYQNVLEVSVTVTDLHDFGFLNNGRYEFRLNQLESHPLAKEFGLTPKDECQDGVQCFDLQGLYWAQFEFEV